MRQLILFGDSRVYGAGDFAAQDYLGVPYPLLPNYYGSGYQASDVLTVTLTGGRGTGGVLAAAVNAAGGVNVYPVTRGSGYRGSSAGAAGDGLPVITVSGGSGVPVSFNFSSPSTSAQSPAGGFLVPMETAIRQAVGFSDFVLNNAGVDGGQTADLVPTATGNYEILDMAVNPTRTPYLWCNFGINEYNTGVTPQQYHDRYASLLTQLTNLGYKVFIDKFYSINPTYPNAATASTAIVTNWHPVIDTLIAAYPGKVFLGSDDNAVFQAHPEYYFDQLHPNAAGDAFLASSKAARFLQIAGPSFVATPAGVAISANGLALTVSLSLPAAGPGTASDFVLSNAAGVSASALSADGLTLTLTPRRRIFAAETPTLSYAGTSVAGVNKVPVQPFTALAVTNSSTRRAFGPPAFLNVAYPGFTWPIVAGATGYRLYQNGILVYDTVNAAGANTATSFTDSAAADGRPIDQPTFTVSAYDGTGEGPQSGTPDGTAATLLGQGTVLVTLTDGAVVNGQVVRLSGPQRVIIDDVRYDVPVGVPTLVPPSVRSVLQNVGLIA